MLSSQFLSKYHLQFVDTSDDLKNLRTQQGKDGYISLCYLLRDKKWVELECSHNYRYTDLSSLCPNKAFWDREQWITITDISRNINFIINYSSLKMSVLRFCFSGFLLMHCALICQVR